MEIPFVDTVATGRNIDRLRVEAGLSVRDMQTVFGFATHPISMQVRNPTIGMRMLLLA